MRKQEMIIVGIGALSGGMAFFSAAAIYFFHSFAKITPDFANYGEPGLFPWFLAIGLISLTALFIQIARGKFCPEPARNRRITDRVQ
jgi:hypothetical protein